MKTIIINEKATIKANGNLYSGHCKPIICIETGDVYTSVTDAAEAFGTCVSNMCACLTGKTCTVRGKHFCYVSKANESLDAIVARLRETSKMEEKAKMWDAMIAEQEAARKAEEKRLEEARKEEERRIEEARKAEEKRIADLARAAARKQRQQELYERAVAKANEMLEAIAETDMEIANLKGKEEEVA